MSDWEKSPVSMLPHSGRALNCCCAHAELRRIVLSPSAQSRRD